MFSQEMVFSGVTSGSATQSETVETNQDFLRSDAWRKIVMQVESALCREDRSRQALDQLQQLAAEQGASTQFLLKSVIRETIRLTLECVGEATDLLKRCEAALTLPTSVQAEAQAEILPAKPVALVLTPEQKEAKEDAAVFTAIARALQSAKPEKNILDRLRPVATPTLSPIEILQQAAQTREASLLALCNEFRQHRAHKSLSLKQIHASTFIPLHHLQSLEENKFDRLPEDVYLRGFLRRLEKCFNLADGKLSHHLPALAQTNGSNLTSQSMAPSKWSTTDQRSSISGLSVNNNPNYAYIAYAALMAGGVCWIAQQGSPKSNLPSIQIDTPVSGPQNAPQKMSSQQIQQTQAKLTQNIAHPEAFA